MNNNQRKFNKCEYCGEPTVRPRFCSAECYDLFYSTNRNRLVPVLEERTVSPKQDSPDR